MPIVAFLIGLSSHTGVLYRTMYLTRIISKSHQISKAGEKA